MGSGVSGYQDLCGDRVRLECPYSVCRDCPLAMKPEVFVKLHDNGATVSRIQLLTGAAYVDVKHALVDANRMP